MKPLFRTWLEELRADGLHLSPEPGDGANQNLWCISLPSSEPVTTAELVEFLRAAMAVRAELPRKGEPFLDLTLLHENKRHLSRNIE